MTENTPLLTPIDFEEKMLYCKKESERIKELILEYKFLLAQL